MGRLGQLAQARTSNFKGNTGKLGIVLCLGTVSRNQKGIIDISLNIDILIKQFPDNAFCRFKGKGPMGQCLSRGRVFHEGPVISHKRQFDSQFLSIT